MRSILIFYYKLRSIPMSRKSQESTGSFRTYVRCGRCRNPERTPPPWAGVSRVADIRLLPIAWLWVLRRDSDISKILIEQNQEKEMYTYQLGTWAVHLSEWWWHAESRRGRVCRSAWFRSRRRPPPSNSIGICTRESPPRASGTSVLLPRHYNRRTLVLQDRTPLRLVVRRNAPHHRSKPSDTCSTRSTRTVPSRKWRHPDSGRQERRFLPLCKKRKSFDYRIYSSGARKRKRKNITCASLRIPGASEPSFVRPRRAPLRSPIARSMLDGPSAPCKSDRKRSRRWSAVPPNASSGRAGSNASETHGRTAVESPARRIRPRWSKSCTCHLRPVSNRSPVSNGAGKASRFSRF